MPEAGPREMVLDELARRVRNVLLVDPHRLSPITVVLT